MSDSTTFTDLGKWHSGDRDGLQKLLKKHLPWIREHVHKRLGPALRQKVESGDIVQEAFIEFLEYGPRFRITSDEKFRALMARIVENVLRDQYRWFTTQRRHMAKERPLNPSTILDIDSSNHVADSSSRAVLKQEQEAWVRFGIELLNPEDREIVVLREWGRLSFPEIGKKLGTAKDAVRMRFNRTLARLSEIIGALRRGKIDRALGEDSG